MSKLIAAPGSYIQGKGEIQKLADYFALLGEKKAYIIVDAFIDKTYHAQIIESFNNSNTPYTIEVFGGECHRREIESHQNRLDDADVVIGIGGGKTLDTAKAVAYYAKLAVIIVPTTASSDAPCSRLSVLYTESGEVETYLFLPSNPDIVVMDINLVIQAPVRFLSAGMGDALATYYEAAACQQSGSPTLYGNEGAKTALALAKLCLDTLFEDGVKAKIAVEKNVCTKAVENIIEANTYLSGIGFESGGVAAAHSVHNGLAILPQCHHLLHGEKVAFGVVTQLVLQNSSMEEIETVVKFCKSIDLPTSFAALGIENISDDELMQVAETSCELTETIHNMPFKVTALDVFNAMKVADQLGR